MIISEDAMNRPTPLREVNMSFLFSDIHLISYDKLKKLTSSKDLGSSGTQPDRDEI